MGICLIYNFNSKVLKGKNILDVPEITLPYVVVLEDWEISPGNLKLLDKKLGEGQFGIVRQGLLTTGKGDEVVAVKTLKGTESTSFSVD